MIDIQNAYISFKKIIDIYKDLEDELGFTSKLEHTYHVAKTSKELAIKLNLDTENIYLAELIGLLHDIGRFEEFKVMHSFKETKFDHAEYGVKMLFEDNLIANFVSEEKYYPIIRNAIYNHNKYQIQDNLDDESLLHSKIIRDSDKLDNFRIETEQTSEKHFVNIVTSIEDIENSLISDEVLNSIRNHECVKIIDRQTPLDYYICLLGFVFDINFKESFDIIKNKNYISIMIDKFSYTNTETRKNMKEIKQILLDYIDKNTWLTRKRT